MRGAGGNEGGIGRFLIGLVMFIGGSYLFLQSIHVGSTFGLGHNLYHGGGVTVTSGMVLIPFILGVGMIFYKANNLVGWLLAVGSMVALVFGVLQSLNFRMRPMSAFELLGILVLTFGGMGIFLSSLRNREHMD
jgi:hypothetical protein